ncbi:hypothetical protein [Raineyella sp. LH-20]|uniref:hypothetical protein n=1 Tax=Raineyella sp. LH-20 TaxID=3081204 RepID=UPI0029550B04|nr:hypothetical protein [Raineyella sp. LH-20]WOP20119.1 hypothetical protein R0146_07535 [Raineyella sp. LH-20]
MTTESLHELVGQIAGFDAAVDWWLMLIAAEVVGVDERVMRILLRSDSSAAKVSKIKQLIEGAGAPQAAVFEPLTRVSKLKDRRDEAVHAYYVEGVEGEYTRHRIRSAPVTVNRVDLEELRDDYQQLVGRSRAAAGDAAEFQRDCFEVLAAYRLQQSGRIDALQEASETGELVLTLFGQGRFEVGVVEASDPRDDLSQPQATARIQLRNGRVDLTLADGREVSGGDTGWRDVLEQVRTVTPSARRRYWRRTNDLEQYVSDEREWWPPAGLDERLTSESAVDLMARWQRERQAFLSTGLDVRDPGVV